MTKMKLLITLTIIIDIITITFSSSATSLLCETTLSAVNSEKEYHCPPYRSDWDLPSLTVQVKPDWVGIECSSGGNLSILPENIYDSTLKVLSFKFCPFPESFKEVSERMGIKVVENLKYRSYNWAESVVKRDLFKGLDGLKSVDFLECYIREIEGDAFGDLIHVKGIRLSSSRIKGLPDGLLSGLSDLEQLDLSHNEISELPVDFFGYNSQLKLLHLWSNKLRTLDVGSFSSLLELEDLELSRNRLEFIPEGLFKGNIKLKRINLSYNNLGELSDETFQLNKNLESIRINFNNLRNLGNIFKMLPNLKTIELKDNKITNLSEEIFQNSTNLQEIDLTNNNIYYLPNIFKNLSKLKVLNLNSNKLETVSSDVFKDLISLEKLHLYSNSINNIEKGALSSLKNLEMINLKNNNLSVLYFDTFFENSQLTEINLANNKLTLERERIKDVFSLNWFNHNVLLKILDLSHNRIEDAGFLQNLVQANVEISRLDLSYNFIKEIEVISLQKVSNHELLVNLSNNNLQTIDFHHIEILSANQPNLDILHSNDFSTVIDISTNPIRCDCTAHDLTRYIHDLLDPSVKTLFNIITKDVICTDQPDVRLEELRPIDLTCPLHRVSDGFDECPSMCACFWRVHTKSVEVDCRNENLTVVPDLGWTSGGVMSEVLGYNQTVVFLQGNALEAGPGPDDGYDNVTGLFLSRNFISNVSWVPPEIKDLALDNNQLKTVPNGVLEQLNTSRAFSRGFFGGNPWTCDCQAANFSSFLLHHVKQIDSTDVRCSDGRLLVKLNEQNLCHNNRDLILCLSIILVGFLFVLAVLTALFYRYQQEVKIWLYAHNLFLWYVTEDEVDKDKVYDAFICFSHKDSDFVANKLLPTLEEGPHPYKICVHYRDWIPGEFITTQIVESVCASRRTIIVLSRNFLDSVWGLMEFRTAHKQSMSDGRARVVVVIYGDLDTEKDLDEELKAYVSTNTYVKWGDPWFWEKIRYALPHGRNGGGKKGQRLSNIMYAMEEKKGEGESKAREEVGFYENKGVEDGLEEVKTEEDGNGFYEHGKSNGVAKLEEKLL